MARYKEGLIGVKLLYEQFQKIDPVTRAAILEAIEETCPIIRAKAVSRAPRRFGYLQSSIDWEVNKKTGEGRVGIRRGQIKGAIGFMVSKGRTGTKQSARIHIIRKGGQVHRTELIMPSRYAHLMEFGTNPRAWKSRLVKGKHGDMVSKRTGRIPKTPNGRFMLPAAESEREPFAQRVKGKGIKIERDLSVSRFM